VVDAQTRTPACASGAPAVQRHIEIEPSVLTCGPNGVGTERHGSKPGSFRMMTEQRLATTGFRREMGEKSLEVAGHRRHTAGAGVIVPGQLRTMGDPRSDARGRALAGVGPVDSGSDLFFALSGTRGATAERE
jgi:hypothetical protein